MKVDRELTTARILAMAAMFAVYGGAATAGLEPVINPNGSFSGTIDGHLVELPVHCASIAGALLVDSHDQPISNSTTTGGVEPALNITAFEKGFQIVVFVGGERYKILRATDTIEAFPFTLAREVRASNLGKIEVDFTVDCPNPQNE